MKKIIMMIGILSANLGFSLSLEIVPMQLRAGVEVLGVKAEVNGSRAVIFAGQTARNIARAAGTTLNTTTHVIVATGTEVAQLVNLSLRGVSTVGRTALITSAEFAFAATDLALDAVHAGLHILSPAVHLISNSTRLVLNGLNAATHTAVVLVADTGVRVFRTGMNVIGNLLSIPMNLLGIFTK